MSTLQRILLVAAVVVVAALGFVVLKPDDEPSRPASTATGPTAGQPAAPAQPSGDGAASTGGTGGGDVARPARPKRPAAPAGPEIVVRGGQPVGGVKDVTLRKGETIRFTVVSDQPDEVHLHGYDVEKPVAPGRPARFTVPAEIEGIFEAELHHSGAQIASVTVEP